MIKGRQSLAVGGAVCIILLVATGLVMNTRPRNYFKPSVPGTQAASPSLKLHGDQDFTNPSPAPSDALREFSKFEGYALAGAECDTEFKDLFKEIERSGTHRKSIGKVTPADLDLHWIDDGGVRAMIHRQKLFILESKLESEYHLPRALSILHQIDRAITASPELVPDIEFSFIVKDLPDEAHAHHTYWALSKLQVDKEAWLMPDFGFWTWPLDLVGAYEQIRVEGIQNQVAWEKRIPKVLWRGALKTNKDVRGALYRVTRSKEWADVEEVKWKSRTKVSAGSAASALSMVDHCNYKFLVHTEGRSYSGRGKYLLNCGSVVITHKSQWMEPHHAVYINAGLEQNVVEVERDFSDLEEKVLGLLKEPNLAHKIATNGQKTFRDRHLTPAAQACYWRKLFHAWANVSFQPKPFETVDGRARLRGVPFETFVVQALTKSNAACPLWKKVTLQC